MEYASAREIKAMPRQQLPLEGDAVLDIPGIRVLNCTQVLRTDDEVLSRALHEYGPGIVSDEGWAVAQRMMATRLSPEATHLWPYNSHAREKAFSSAVELAQATGADIRVRVDPVGERMKEDELRAVEEQYIVHKLAVVIGERYLLVVTERAPCFQFADGTWAWNNISVLAIKFEKGMLGEDEVVVRCDKRPSGDNVLTLPMLARE
eukprot:6097852-Prymnesium_polylepis.1